MIGAKSTQTSSRDNHRQDASYTFFMETIVAGKYVVGCTLSVIIPTTLVCELFAPTILLTFISYLFCIHVVKLPMLIHWKNNTVINGSELLL